jgi:hypothetical protein
MQAAVRRDTTTRVIMLGVSGVPDIDVTRHYHRRPRIFRPQFVTLRWVDGELASAKVDGGLVLKSGGASESAGESETFYPETSSWATPKMDKAPEWLHLLVAEAPQGVTSWNAGEVQAL